jgi:hypothetical protein
MHKKLASAFAQAETERHAILVLLQNVPEETLVKQHDEKWSPSQIISHLILSETMSLQYMKKKSLGIVESGTTGLWDEFKFLLLTISQTLPIKYKAPKVLAESQPETLPYHELKSRWDATRGELETFLNSFDDRFLKKKVYKHPVVGRLNILQALNFIRAHIKHHLLQIKKRIV